MNTDTYAHSDTSVVCRVSAPRCFLEAGDELRRDEYKRGELVPLSANVARYYAKHGLIEILDHATAVDAVIGQ